MDESRAQKTFSVKSQIQNTASVTTIQFFNYSVKATIDNLRSVGMGMFTETICKI